MSEWAEHARHELERIGEEPYIIDWFVAVIEKFAELEHTGSTAEICIYRLNLLLQFKALSPLTSDPIEWQDRSDISGYPVWQSARDSEAFSEDGGQTYYLTTEQVANHARTLHTSALPITNV